MANRIVEKFSLRIEAVKEVYPKQSLMESQEKGSRNKMRNYATLQLVNPVVRLAVRVRNSGYYQTGSKW